MTPISTRPLRQFLAAGALAAIALAAAPAAFAEERGDDAAPAMTKGEERLATMLEGRVAGEPQSCIRNFPHQRLTVIENTAYVYGRGRTIYVQRTRNPEHIDRDDALVTRQFNGSQLCRLDVATTIDPLIGQFTGAVFFEDFIPYTRVEEDEG
jgi:hypothetical protein